MQDASPKPLHFYISYYVDEQSPADENWAEWIGWQLEKAGYRVELAKWDLLVGQNKVLKNQEELAKAERVILVLSPDALNSLTLKSDWAALHDQRPEALLPILVRECKRLLPLYLTSLKNINLVGLDAANARNELLLSISSPKKPTTAPLFPGEMPGTPSSTPHFPGDLPPVWFVPPYNQFFTDREEILVKLRQAFRIDKTSLTQIQVINGMGGIGKTQTALAYAYQYRDNYEAVLWITADTPDIFLSDLAKIAAYLGLPGKESKDRALLTNAVKDWLNTHRDWLLILDNVEDVKIAHSFIPSVGNGHILLTTRALATGTLAGMPPIELDGMAGENSALFLLRRAKLLPLDATIADVPLDDYALACTIAHVLGHLPLALDQAGAYIEETARSLEDYLPRYERQRSTLLARRGALPSDSSPDHPASVLTTLNQSFDKARNAHSGTFSVLQFCAFLHSNTIPEEILLEAIPEISNDLDDIIVELRRSSLVHRHVGGTLSVHRLVQAVLRDQMDRDTQYRWAKRAVRAVSRVFFTLGEPVEWQHCWRYFPHVQACAALIEEWSMDDEEATSLLHRMGRRLQAHTAYALAEPLFIPALAIWPKTQGAGLPPMVAVLISYASLLRSLQSHLAADELEALAEIIRANTAST